MATTNPTPPFKADVVGSLLRPLAIHDARARQARGEMSAEALWELQRQAIEDAVALQKNAGLRVCTDGEFHRRHWFLDFIEKIDGIVFAGGLPTKFHNENGEVEFAPPRAETRSKLKRTRPLAVNDFRDLKPIADRVGLMPKQPIPSPTLVHFRGGRAAIDKTAYPEMDAFFADLAQVYREDLQALYDAGCRYVQIDETNLPFLCDPALQDHARRIGETPEKLVETYVQLLNDCLRDLPADMTVCMHMCRGNHASSWVASGGYDPIAEAVFSRINIRGFFLEYDTPRAGSFEPLRYLGKDKIAVLGLVTTKKAQLETQDELKRRIDEAAKIVPIERLALSPQCGFASTIEGNRLTVDDEKRKLALVVETAREVWGTA